MEFKSNFCEKYKNKPINNDNRKLFLKDFYKEIGELFEKDLDFLKSENKQDAEKFKKLKYAVFYSNPFYTLKKGDIYFLGINPGGDVLKEDCNCYSKESYEDFLKPKYEKYFDYTDGNWYGNNNREYNGQHPLQKKITSVLKIVIEKFELDTNLYDILCTNLYFYRSRILTELKTKRDFWEYHNLFLNIVKPKLIICMGNNEDDSPYQNVKSYLNGDEKRLHIYGTYSFKWFYTYKESWQRNKILVLGIPHLSRCKINISKEFKDFLELHFEKF